MTRRDLWQLTGALACAALLGGATAPARAQEVRVPASAQEPRVPAPRPERGWTLLRVSKWTVLGASAGAAVYGYRETRLADRRYQGLERECLAVPEVCERRTADGGYLSAELEARYQDVRRADGRARSALLASQVGIAASVVLFVLDLRNSRAPGDIRYEPEPLELRPGRDGGIELRLTRFH